MAAERPVRPLVMALLFGRLVEAHCLRYRELATHSVAMATGKAEPRVLHGSGCLARGRLSSEEVSGQGARSLVVFLLKAAASVPVPSSTHGAIQEHPSNRPHPLCTPIRVASVSSLLAQHEESTHLFRDGRVENFALELQVRLVYARLRLGVMLD